MDLLVSVSPATL